MCSPRGVVASDLKTTPLSSPSPALLRAAAFFTTPGVPPPSRSSPLLSLPDQNASTATAFGLHRYFSDCIIEHRAPADSLFWPLMQIWTFFERRKLTIRAAVETTSTLGWWEEVA
ncbi:hypothetical protein L596_023696 [Steinernema carpocapsae]|uniref:Uncharacterized protein n=1 Tax=Steinernema carpocapsae TaxID=34508 RepID=A0A4U5MF70_STECR|nr:hypothetical protein L596_023696 [Steinernema carpocapsae]